MGTSPAAPNGWPEINRNITADFQQFEYRPVDETQNPRRCNGCAPRTAILTAYAPGKFDPSEARSGQRVAVDGADEAYFRPTDDTDDTKDATLTWQYADNAWATAVGLTDATSGLDRLTELARALKPGERTPIRLPLTVAHLPAGMPLAQIEMDTSPVQDAARAYGTTVTFAQCGRTDTGATRPCMTARPNMEIRILPRNDTGHVQTGDSIPVAVGGRDGYYDAGRSTATVQAAPDVYVEFRLTTAEPEAGALKRVLADVAWAPNPADQSTWPAVREWAK
jgi:hypothetical protein